MLKCGKQKAAGGKAEIWKAESRQRKSRKQKAEMGRGSGQTHTSATIPPQQQLLLVNGAHVGEH
jgi:hypothetical protein